MTEIPQNATQGSGAEGGPRIWRFGSAELDEGTLELRVNGRRVVVEHKPLEVLLCLLRHGDEVVTKDQILDAVWPGRILTESVLTKCVGKLRDALDDHGQHLIKTLHGQGYRMAIPITAEPSTARHIEGPGASEEPVSPNANAASLPSRTQWQRLAAGAAVGVIAVGLVIWFAGKQMGATPAAEKSVAVLPFANLSADPGNQYFTDGLHDTILTHLAHVQDLRVISRTSVMQYPQGARNLRQIASELGVAHIVEGSVQRADNRLRVNAQLIQTATDAHVWAAQYDRELSDVFAVQAEIAQQIAGAVQARLTPEEKARIARVPTKNTAAYELYLRALETSRRQTPVPTETREAIARLEQAVSMDAEFALAYALLSSLHDLLFWWEHDPSETRLAKVRDAAETALRLDPDLAEAHTARAIYLYHGSRNYAAAIQELEQAKRIAPNDARVHAWLAFIYRRQGLWDEAVASLVAAIELDPRNEYVASEYAETLEGLRRYAEADQVYARLTSFASRPALIKLSRAYLQLYWKGELEPLEQALKEIPPEVDPGCGISLGKWNFKVWRRQFSEAAAAILACPESDTGVPGAGTTPKEYFAALSYQFGGELRQARSYFEKARVRLEESLRLRPDQPASRIALAYSLAALGERQAALAEADRALASMPLSRDALIGAATLRLVAQFHASVGEPERALDELERALRLPYGGSAHPAQLNPAYDSLRNDPRFRKLIAEHLPKE